MGLKRRPPVGNVRRVQHIEGNALFTITSKANDLIQCESFNERKFALRLERDRTVSKYASQPEKFLYVDSSGRKHSVVPDFMLWRTDGTVEIHDVTIERRLQEKLSLQERRDALRAICDAKGIKYFLHTEKTLPNDTEVANLLAVYCFRPRVYLNHSAAREIRRILGEENQAFINTLINRIVTTGDMEQPIVTATMFNMLWHSELETDWQSLLFHDASPTKHSKVWLNNR